MCIGGRISVPQLRNAGRQNSQFAGYLDSGPYSIFTWYSDLHCRNVTEASFPCAHNTDGRLWWLGWRDYFSERYMSLSNFLRVRRMLPSIEISDVIPASVAHKSPRINVLDLNRDLPPLPLDTETGVFRLSLSHEWTRPTSSGQAHVSAV
jgi:hypothetical protein